MRTNAFGEYVIDNEDDNLGDYLGLAEIDPAEVYAQVFGPQDGITELWSFEIFTKEDGNEVIKSMDLFKTNEDLVKYLTKWLDSNDIELMDE